MMMTDSGKNSIGNFTVENIREIDVVNESGSIPSVGFTIKLETGESSGEIIIALDGPKGLRQIDLYSLHPHITISKKGPAAQHSFVNFIRSKLPDAPKETQYSVNRLGTHMIGDKPVFNTGGGLIWSSPDSKNKPAVILEPQKYRLDIAPDLGEYEAAAGMMEVVSLSPDAGRVIFAHTLLYIMRSVYETARKAPCCSLLLYGKTGTAKTTYAAFLTQLHNRSQGIAEPVRLNATIAAAEMVLSERSDCAVILDDLFPTEYRDMKNRQEKTLIEITRIIGDGSGRARTKGGQAFQKKPTCGVIFTSEYLIGTGSTAARLLPVRFATPIDDGKLRKCQSKPLVVSTFYHYFIQWYIDNYAKIQHFLGGWWNKYTETDVGVHRRLWETHFFLNSAYLLFLRYCVEKNFISTESFRAHHGSFETLLTRLVRDQDVRVTQGKESEPEKVDLFELIRGWYQNNLFDLAKDVHHLGSSHDGIKKDELLCLRSDKLMKKVQEVVPSATLTDVRRVLVAKNALWLDGEGKNKKIGQQRFVGIYLSKLK